MLKFITNKNAIMGLTLSNIALFIATGILLSAVFSFIYLSDFNRKAELDNISNSFTTFVEAMDTKFFENCSKYYFPIKDYQYKISISTEFINVESDGFWNNKIYSRNKFLIKPLPIYNNIDWNSSKTLHNFLKTKFGYSGNESNPINNTKESDVKNYFNDLKDKANLSFALNPFIIDFSKDLFVEKIYIFYNVDSDNFWDKEVDYKKDIIVIYQK